MLVRNVTIEKPLPIVEAAGHLSCQIFPHNNKKRKLFFAGLQEMYSAALIKTFWSSQSGRWEWLTGKIYKAGKRVLDRSHSQLENSVIVNYKGYLRSGDALWGGEVV